jgi:hypothetical protein
MTPIRTAFDSCDPIDTLKTDRAAEHAYNAFVDAIREFTPPVVQTWRDLHPRVRNAWVKAAEAAILSA